MTESSKNLSCLNAQLTKTQETIKFLLYKLGVEGGNSTRPPHLRQGSMGMLNLAVLNHCEELCETCDDIFESLVSCEDYTDCIHVDRSWQDRHPRKRVGKLREHVLELRKIALDCESHGENHGEYKRTAQKLIKQIAAEIKQALDEIVELENIVN